MNAQELMDTARTLVAGDKGLLAMDESNPTCNKRFAKFGIPQTGEARRAYRELIVTTPRLGECISGIILYDETIRQKKKDGTPFVKAITEAGIVGQALSPSFLFDHHPCRLQQRERDQADQSSRRDEQRIADLPAEQND